MRLRGIEYVREATGVTNLVGRTTLSGDGREAHEDGGLLANSVQETCLAVLSDVVGDLEETVSWKEES